MPGKRIAAIVKYLLVLIILSSACRKDNYIIPAEKFVDVLVDLHLADAIALHNNPRYSGFSLDSTELYGTLFQNHGVTREQFDSTVRYLGSHPDEFLEIYDKVIAKLQILNDEIMNIPVTEVTEKGELIWQDSKVYAFPEMGKDRVEVNIPVRGKGEYILEVTMKIYDDDESRNPKLSVYFWYDDHTTDGYHYLFPEVPLRKGDEQATYTTSKILDDEKVTYIKGYLIDYANRNDDFTQHALITEVTLYYKP